MPDRKPKVVPEKILKWFEIIFAKPVINTFEIEMRAKISWKKASEEPVTSAEQIIRKTCSACCWIGLDVRVPRPNLLDEKHIWFSPPS
jgi:hypothetical protein